MGKDGRQTPPGAGGGEWIQRSLFEEEGETRTYAHGDSQGDHSPPWYVGLTEQQILDKLEDDANKSGLLQMHPTNQNLKVGPTDKQWR